MKTLLLFVFTLFINFGLLLNSNAQSNKSFEEKPESYVSFDLEKIGFELMNLETFGKLKIGQHISIVLENLGTPETKSEKKYWEADGEHHTNWNYTSKGLKIGFIGDDEQNLVVDRITITAPCKLFSARGIQIGDSEEKIRKAYPIAIANNQKINNWIIAGTTHGGLMFEIENDKVKTMFLGVKVE